MPGTISTKIELQERIKELSCLYEISSVIRDHEGEISATLEKISEVLKQAWRFPEDAVVELKLNGFQHSTGKIPQKNVAQQAFIYTFSEVKGAIKIYYPQEKHRETAFLPEEQKLLEKAAHEVGSFYEKIKQKEQEELLRRSIHRNDRLAILGEITAGIAHELNTPLGNILGFAELIKERAENSQTKKDIGKIIKAAIYSREVVKKLMFFACEIPQEMKIIKIQPIVAQALSLLKPNFKKAGVECHFRVADKGIEAQLDPIQLTQVLFNLLINALYFSPQGSAIEVKLYRNEASLYIEIADEGPGIKEELKSKIFEPFFTTKPIGDGSGLGLSVVHGIIRSHKGNIVALDNQPQGSIFQISIPLRN
ncbi:sensor histidine kinase [Salinimicrobium tongyeongense]|uniref:histidine kinase n=1 Tax=Salinimicrobium tongyeongense TaxID=2809707 RepID=A0ABY6NQ03_9FLAO|nr:ATP-binding protein [Salinimicrobium tongyeongense]UZH54952.1 sensor histidine kinase [Salinimicrobium tongyeongense]